MAQTAAGSNSSVSDASSSGSSSSSSRSTNGMSKPNRAAAVGDSVQHPALLGAVALIMVVVLADPLALKWPGLLGKSAALATLVLALWRASLGLRAAPQKPSAPSREPQKDPPISFRQTPQVRSRFVALSTASANTQQPLSEEKPGSASSARLVDTYSGVAALLSPARAAPEPDPMSPAMKKVLKQHRLSLDLTGGPNGRSPVRVTPIGGVRVRGPLAGPTQEPNVRRANLVPRGVDARQRTQRIRKHATGQFQSASVSLPSRAVGRISSQNDPLPDQNKDGKGARSKRTRPSRKCMTPMAGGTRSPPRTGAPSGSPSGSLPPSDRSDTAGAAASLEASVPSSELESLKLQNRLLDVKPPTLFFDSVVVSAPISFRKGSGDSGSSSKPGIHPQHSTGPLASPLGTPLAPGGYTSRSEVLASPACSMASQLSSDFGDDDDNETDGLSRLPIIDEEDHVSDVDIIKALSKAPRLPTDSMLFRVAFVLKQEILGNVSRRRRKRQRKRRGALASTLKQRELWDVFELPADLTGADAEETHSLHEAVFCVVAKLFFSAQLSVDTLLASLVFLRRLTERAGLVLTEDNWAGVLFTAVVLGQKWVDDVSYPTASVIMHCPIFTMDQLRPMEHAAIQLAEWHLAVEDVHTIAVIRHFGLYSHI